ncbi:extracellular solute-binding protein [Paenarthrobacter sp. RAF54_2]|uniref:extracellular solute-binding protein n=1 Tax=Paenarthrobacter sp. RAF54_2 TaxID=3233061 RepID=UPI003F9ACE74
MGKVAFAYPAQALWAVHLPAFALTSTLVYGQDPGFSEVQADGRATFSESKWSEALGKVLEMRDRGCFQQGFLGTPIERAADQVAKGSAFAVISTSSTLGTVAAAAGDPGNIGMFVLPATENPKDTWVPASAGNGLSVNSKAKNPVGAMRFIEFLSKPEEAAAAADAQNVARVVASAWTHSAVLDPLFEKIDAGRAAALIDQTWPNPELAVNEQEEYRSSSAMG